ncbi:LamG domain-containing protein [bacterium]|nr:LamG domain-containing protein [bacterium]
MKKAIIGMLITLFIFLFGCSGPKEKSLNINVKLGEFGAFYTKINSGEKFEKYSRTGDYTDIVVDLGRDKNALVFWRGSSYLPFFQTENGRWYVDEIIKRKGDGTKRMPDRTNAYSFVKIVKNTPEEVVINWRYLPVFTRSNPQHGVSPYKFVEENFLIKPDGSVIRTIRKGTKRIDEWNDPLNKITQKFTLTPNGIRNVTILKPGKSIKVQPVGSNPIVGKDFVKPVACWKFDEAKGNQTTESITRKKSEIEGNKSLWRKGVSGTALQFDGYFSKITFPAEEAPKLTDEVTFSAWVVIGAYPWNYVPIIQQVDDVPEVLVSAKGQKAILTGEDGREDIDEDEMKDFGFIMKPEDDRGYFFGLDGDGKPTFKIRVAGKWEEFVADYHLERRTWYFVAATYSKESGKMSVFVNGTLVGEKQIGKANIELSKKDICIGQGKKRRPTHPVRMNTFSDFYSIDGLLDEVKIYDVALSGKQIKKEFDSGNMTPVKLTEVEMDKRILPKGENRHQFGAYYQHLKYYDVWDNLWRFGAYPDVVVEFDELPTKFVFWRGVGFIPMMVNEKGQWYSNEFNETWNKTGGKGCQEPMSDKESYFNHARIIENTPARTVVHWRYPLVDVRHVMANYHDETGWCDWADWYYYIYPDGIAVKTMHLWTDGERNHEWQESMAIFGPDQHPEQIIHTKSALTMLNLKGDSKTYDWINGPPDNIEKPKEQCIQYVNYTGKYKPVTIGDFEWSNVYGGEITPYSVFPTWNHWPVSQMPSDGRYASYPDRAAHSSLSHVSPSTYKEVLDGPAPYYEKIMMEGMMNQKPQYLVPLARSWMSFAKLKNLKGARGGYEPGQRAYLLNLESKPVSFVVDASSQSPIENLSFVVKGWNDDKKASAKINGKKLAVGKKFRQGIFRDINGTSTLVIWIEFESAKAVSIEIN